MIATDWRRYNIRNCRYPFPFSAELISTDPCLWEYQRPALHSWEWDLGTVNILIPTWYRMNGTSCPRHAYSIVDPIASLIGSGLHDLLYETQCGLRPFRIWKPTGGYDLVQLLDAVTHQPIPFLSNNCPADDTMDRLRARADAVMRCFWHTANMHWTDVNTGYCIVRAAGGGAWQSEEPPLEECPILPAQTGRLLE